MENQSVIVLTGLAIAKAAILTAIPVFATRVIWAGLGKLVPAGFFQMPIIYTFARIAGLGLGLALIYAHKGGAYYDLHIMFLPESPWNTTLWTFIYDRVNPLNFGPGAIYDRLGLSDRNVVFTEVVALLVILYLVAVGNCLKTWRGKDFWSSAIGVTVITVWMAYVSIYVLSLIFWLMFMLNSWTFLLLAFVVQFYRRRSVDTH